MYLVPPMDEVPPGDFVHFVETHLTDLQREAARLTGGYEHAEEIYPDVLADVAGHWRRLRLRCRFVRRRDVPGEFLAHRLEARAKQWRSEQIYEVEVQLLRPPRVRAVATASIALRKAALLPDTVRVQQRPIAEASIAWSHAWRRARWHGIARVAAAILLLFISLMQSFPTPST
jgi:hypothetical protein